MTRLLRVLPCLLTVAAFAAEPDATRPVDVPDPVGLGERLALIDWLRERGQAVADGATVEQLRLAYLRAAHPDLFAAPAVADPDARERDELTLTLWRRYGRNPPEGAGVAELRDLLAALDRDQDARVARDAARAREDAAASAPDRSPIPATASPDGRGAAGPRGTGSITGSARASAQRQRPTEASVDASEPIDDAHASAWANYANPPSEIKGSIDFRLYRHDRDDGHVYLWTNNRNRRWRSALVTIDGRSRMIFVASGVCRTPLVFASADPAHATLSIGDVHENWTGDTDVSTH